MARQDEAAVVSDEGRPMKVALTGLVNETLNGTAAVTGRKMLYRVFLSFFVVFKCRHLSQFGALMCAHTVHSSHLMQLIYLRWLILQKIIILFIVFYM